MEPANPENEELTRKREEFTSEIRKNTREDFFRKKRAPKPEESLQMNPDKELKLYIDSCLQKTFSYDDFSFLVENLTSGNLRNEYLGIIGLRKLLSLENHPPIQLVIDSNLIPKMIELMGRNDQPSLQLESTWCLTNVATGDSYQIQTILDRGGLNALIGLMRSPLLELVDQAIWALGNIAGDSIVFRDLIIKEGAHLIIEKALVSNSISSNIFKNASWALANLCRGKPKPNLETLKHAIPIFARVLREYGNEEHEDIDGLADALWALSYLTTGNEKIVESIILNGCVASLVDIFDKQASNLSILLPCIRTLGNILTGSTEQTTEVIKHGGIERFFALLSHEKKTLRKEACWALSNITAQSPTNISLIFSNPLSVKKLLTLVTIDCDEIKKEAAWVLCNCSKFGLPVDVMKLVELGGLEMFESLLDSKDHKMLLIGIEGINNILFCGHKHFKQEGPNPFLLRLENTKAIQKLEELQLHPNDEVYEKIILLLENFFETDQTL